MVRSCNDRCHSARGSKCACWCGGTFHGAAGAMARQQLLEAATEPEKLKLLADHGFVKGSTMYRSQPRLPLDVDVKPLTLLPPANGKCPECAGTHLPIEPHDKNSLFYQVKFKNEHGGREATWRDAMAHCSDWMKAAWTKELANYGIKVE